MTETVPIGAPPVRARLTDGRRRHFQHGPIDLVLEAFGAPHEVAMAYEQAWSRFRSILIELVGELPLLRAPVRQALPTVSGPVARRMYRAAAAHRATFVTPMAAVAGAVADEVLWAMTTQRRLDKAYVNDGGDIALFLKPGESFRAGVVTLGEALCLDGFTDIHAASEVRGLATSGWHGRSLSLGIADSVTVLAGTAAEADVAATLIANAVDVTDPSIRRQAASSIDPDSDLGDRPVTVAVGRLAADKVEQALDRGRAAAEAMLGGGLIAGALLSLQGRRRAVGGPGAMLPVVDVERASQLIAMAGAFH